jgi:hypothetical protein
MRGKRAGEKKREKRKGRRTKDWYERRRRESGDGERAKDCAREKKRVGDRREENETWGTRVIVEI